MKSMVRCLALAVFLLPSMALAVDTELNSTTIFRLEKQSFPGFARKTLAPATEFVGFDMDKVGDGNLSLHLYGWGRLDLADKSTDEKDTDGDLTYGYLLYRFAKANGQLKAGRFFIYEGVAAEQIDGLYARADLAAGFALSVFGGAPVKLDRDSRSKGDYIVGGRAGYRFPGVLELGVSALQEGGAFSAISGARDDRQMMGLDIWLSPHRMIELNGHTFYNAQVGGLAENSYLLTLMPHKVLSVSGEYSDQRFKDYFAYANLPVFDPTTGDKLKKYGASVTAAIAKPVEVTADYRHYRRDTLGDSDRYGAEVRLTLLENKLRAALSYHRSKGGDGANTYSEVRGYGLFDPGSYFASLDGIAHFYDNPVFAKHTAYELTAAAGYRITKDLALSGNVSYGDNPQQSDEVKGLVKLTYNFTYASKGARK